MNSDILAAFIGAGGAIMAALVVVLSERKRQRAKSGKKADPPKGSDAAISSGIAGNLSDYFSDVRPDGPLHVELGVKKDGKVALFHNKHLRAHIIEGQYFPAHHRFYLLSSDGSSRDMGTPVNKDAAAHMRESNRLLLVHLKDGKALGGVYVPLKIYQ